VTKSDKINCHDIEVLVKRFEVVSPMFLAGSEAMDQNNRWSVVVYSWRDVAHAEIVPIPCS
jgi:hypothetical protein